MYDDNSPLLEGGKYKFMLLKNVPAQILLSLRGVTKDEELKIYINANLETI